MRLLNIVITFSPNWSRYIAIEMYALFTNNNCPIKVYLLSDNLSEDILNEFDKVCQFCGEQYSYEYIDA